MHTEDGEDSPLPLHELRSRHHLKGQGEDREAALRRRVEADLDAYLQLCRAVPKVRVALSTLALRPLRPSSFSHALRTRRSQVSRPPTLVVRQEPQLFRLAFLAGLLPFERAPDRPRSRLCRRESRM